MTSFLREDWNNSEWVNQDQETYIYDLNGDMNLNLSERWSDSVWVNRWRWTYTYDMNRNLASYVYEDWDGSNWELGYGILHASDMANNEYYFAGSRVDFFTRLLLRVLTEKGQFHPSHCFKTTPTLSIPPQQSATHYQSNLQLI